MSGRIDGLRVAIVSAGELFGGAERHILLLSGGLRAFGVDPVVVLLNEGNLAARARRAGLQTIVVERRSRYDVTTGERLAGLLRSVSAHLIHVHGYQAAVFAALAARKHRFPVVVTQHGRIEGSWKSPLDYLKSKTYGLLEQVAVRRMKAALCYVTRDLETQNRRGHAGLRRYVIYNGVDVIEPREIMRPIEYEQEKLNVACVGRLSEVKGLEYAIGAMGHESMPREAVLHIVGGGPLAKRLEAQAVRSGLVDRVRFLGFKENVLDYIGGSDVLLLPSLHEGLPYTLLEGMALRVPIVASAVGGLTEVLTDKVTAVLVRPRDTAAIAGAIKWIHDNRGLAAAISRAAQKEQRTRFSLSGMCRAYVNVYEEALHASRRAVAE